MRLSFEANLSFGDLCEDASTGTRGHLEGIAFGDRSVYATLDAKNVDVYSYLADIRRVTPDGKHERLSVKVSYEE